MSADHQHASTKGELYGVLAEYDTPGELIAAARRVRDAGYTQFDCYSPFPVHGIDDAMGIKRTILPLLVFGGGITGLVLGMLLQWWMNAYDWPFIISGKPDWSIPANIPIAFETTILLSVFTTFFGMWGLNKLPQVWHPFFRLDRFARATDDAFLLGIEAKDPRFHATETAALLQGAGALAVESCYLDPDPASRRMPAAIYGFIIASTAVALVPFALIANARASKSTEPHVHIFADMDFQPKAKSDSAFPLFVDGRANRGAIGGTVARGSNAGGDAYLRGTKPSDVGPTWITGLPEGVAPSLAMVRRGRERYDIYCAPCHGADGSGKGMIAKRAADANAGALNPANLVDGKGATARMPNGQLFHTISNGYNTMAGYAAQIAPADRWAIVLYVRALQRSQHATASDLPANQCKDPR